MKIPLGIIKVSKIIRHFLIFHKNINCIAFSIKNNVLTLIAHTIYTTLKNLDISKGFCIFPLKVKTQPSPKNLASRFFNYVPPNENMIIPKGFCIFFKATFDFFIFSYIRVVT